MTSEPLGWLPPPTNWNVKFKDGKKLIVKKNKDDNNTIDLVSIYGSVYGIYQEDRKPPSDIKPQYYWIVQTEMFIDLKTTIRLRLGMFFTLNKNAEVLDVLSEGGIINITKDITDISQYLYSEYQGEITYTIEKVDDKDFNASVSGSIFRVESNQSGSCYLVARQSIYTSRVELKWKAL